MPPDPDAHDWCSDYRTWLPLMLLSWGLAWGFQDAFISDWDGFDYTSYAVRNLPSALGLGRALFLAYNHLLWLLAHHSLGVPPEDAYLVLRYGVIAQSGPAILGLYALFKELTASRLGATLGALSFALSPVFIVYSGRAMSEIPAFLMLGWALWWTLRSLRLGRVKSFYVGALLVGLSANIREFAVFYLPAIPLAARHYGLLWRQALLALVMAGAAAAAGPAFWALYRPEYYIPSVITWYRLSAQEAKVHPVTIRNVEFLAKYALACSPVATLLAPFAFKPLLGRRDLRPLLIVGALGLLADLALLANWDLPVNPRYPLTGLLGLAAVSGWLLAGLARRRRRWVTLVFVALAALTAAGLVGMRQYLRGQEPAQRSAREYFAKVEGLPADAVLIVGARTPLVSFYQGIGARPGWQTIASGSGWPDERLGEVIDGYLAAGRPVFVDFDPQLWASGTRERSREAAGLEMIKREYELELIRDFLYRIRKR